MIPTSDAEALAGAVLAWHDARTESLLRIGGACRCRALNRCATCERCHVCGLLTQASLCAHLTAEYQAEVEHRRRAVELVLGFQKR
jgi:hypothetical protein